MLIRCRKYSVGSKILCWQRSIFMDQTISRCIGWEKSFRIGNKRNTTKIRAKIIKICWWIRKFVWK